MFFSSDFNLNIFFLESPSNEPDTSSKTTEISSNCETSMTAASVAVSSAPPPTTTTPPAAAAVTTTAADDNTTTTTVTATVPALNNVTSPHNTGSGLFNKSEKGLPKAMIKPNVLTHVIEGFVIQEANEPFAVTRQRYPDELTDEPPSKYLKFYIEKKNQFFSSKCRHEGRKFLLGVSMD